MPTCGESRVKLVTYDSNLTRKAWFIVPYLVLNSLNKIGLLSEQSMWLELKRKRKPEPSRRADVDSDDNLSIFIFCTQLLELGTL